MTTKRLSAEERRKQILQSAIRVFAQDTYHGATTKRISEEAGITEALIYRYFGSKRTLFTEAIDYTTTHLVVGLEREMERNLDNPLTALTNSINYYVEVLESQEPLAKMIFLVIAELDEEDVREVYLPHQERALKIIADAIQYWGEKGYLKEEAFGSPKTGAWLYFGTYLILALVKHSHGGIRLKAEFAIELAKPYFTQEVFDAHNASE